MGKPYDEDIDMRIEDWMSYECFVKTKNEKAARQMLDKIVKYKRAGGEPRPTFNNLITAWALKKLGKESEAVQYLSEIASKNPNNKIARWTLDAYNGNAPKLDAEANESYDILQQLMVLQLSS